MEQSFLEALESLKEQIEQEIKDHQRWCSPNCETFLPHAYREARLDHPELGPEHVQNDHDLCHIWR